MNANLRQLPNLLSVVRLILSPVIILAAWATGSRPCFLALLAAALLTDALDGFLARRLNAQTDLGRRLDSWGDYATIAAGVAGIGLLWPDVVRTELAWFVAAVAGIFVIVIYGWLRWGKILGYHTWLAKVMVVLLPASLVALLAEWSAAPFHVTVVLQALCGIEELVIAFLLPGYSGEMKSAWHAWRFRWRMRNP